VTTVLMWKEYRQQGAMWIAVAVLAVLLVTTMALTVGQGSGWQLFQVRQLPPSIEVSFGTISLGLWELDQLQVTLILLLLALMVAYGLCAGAGSLAGEREIGTLPFLDNLICQRRPVWQTKVLASVLFTLLFGAYLSVLGWGLGFATWELILAMPLVGLHALAWGLLAGAVSRSVLAAIFLGFAAMLCGFLIAFFLFADDPWLLPAMEAALSLGAAYTSYRVFCRDDLLRRLTAAARLEEI
jgi:hypothetical protein